MGFQYETLTTEGTKVLADCPTEGACQAAKRLLEMPSSSEHISKGRIVEIGKCSQCGEQKAVRIRNFHGLTLDCCDDCVC
jgi:ERCC4-type nuclease